MPEQQENVGWKEALRRIEEAKRSNAINLDLSDLQLTALPETFSQLANLEVLNLHENRLAAIPESLTQLANLKHLNLSDNDLSVLPESLGRLASLEELILHGNKLTTLPEALGQLVNLKRAFFGLNRLKALPVSVGQLANLESLYVFENQLTAIPESLGQLANLEDLILGENKLGMIPASIGQLAKLLDLDLSNNQLIAIPKSLTALPILSRLFLHGNTGLGLPDEILGPTWDDVHTTSGKRARPPKEIFNYYFSKLAGARPLNEAKLILVGQGGVGKTSLVKKLTGQKFKKGEKTTEGIKIRDWPCPLSGKEKVTVHIWDFGGQEMMHATHQFFLTARSLYLLVLNRRPGGIDREIDYWLRMVRQFGGKEAPVIVVLNMQKEEPFNVNRGGLLQKYADNIKGFVETDCKDARSITRLKKKILEELGVMQSLKASFPERWFAIKDELSQMSDQYVTFEHYREICTKSGEGDPERQTSLAGFLHDLGIALNYKDDPRLRFAYVLKPEWVTEGIYALLHAFVESKGLFTRSDAERVLKPKGYRAEAADFIMGLMEQFESAFRSATARSAA
jgi:internalin A